MNKAIFLDRDGTIIIDKHYLYQKEEVEFLPLAIRAMKRLQDAGYQLFIVTNQSGIARGMFSEKDMHQVHQHMKEILNKNDIQIIDIAFCPHAPKDNCQCRKPKPKMIIDLIKKYNIDPLKSYMIGDKISDVEAGENANVTGILLTNNPTHKNEYQSLDEFSLALIAK